jgi:hypothetical protein
MPMSVTLRPARPCRTVAHARIRPRNSLLRSAAQDQKTGHRGESRTDALPPPPASRSVLHGPQSADDVIIGIALTVRWMLVTGRRPRCDRPLFHELPAHELVDFWADDHIEPGPEQGAQLRRSALAELPP